MCTYQSPAHCPLPGWARCERLCCLLCACGGLPMWAWALVRASVAYVRELEDCLCGRGFLSKPVCFPKSAWELPMWMRVPVGACVSA